MAVSTASASPGGAVAPAKAGVAPRRRASAVPLDFSFMGLTSLSEMLQQEPVGGKKKVQVPPTDDLATTSSSVQDVANKDATAVSTKKRATPVSLRVNNNRISTLHDMHEALGAVFEHPQALQWLDLSGNGVASIPPEVFAAYPQLFTLHLHGNRLSCYADVDALAQCLPRLHALTLHGNPLEDKKHFRNYVIASFPRLKQLNFSAVTRGDRDKAETWASIYKHTKPAGGSGRRDDEL